MKKQKSKINNYEHIQTFEAFVEKRKGLFLTDAYYICQKLKDNTEIIKAFEKEEWDKNIAKALAHFFAKGNVYFQMWKVNIAFLFMELLFLTMEVSVNCLKEN